MNVITKASAQWFSRPADERFTSLLDMRAHFQKVRDESYASVVANRRIEFAPVKTGEKEEDGYVVDMFDRKALQVNINSNGNVGGTFDATHHSFNQIAQLAGAPAGYLRTLPAELVANNLNYGLRHNREVEEAGILVQKNGSNTLRAATGPRYGRIWNLDIINPLIEHYGDGVTGNFRVPGEFGKAVTVDKNNTTLYASDRDMFVFLADEENRIEIPNRRDGKSGSLARGFYIWNSEVGDKTLGIGTFLFDFVCMNRTIWGAEQFAEITVRHTAGAPDRFLEEIKPRLLAMHSASAKPFQEAIAEARAKKIDDDVDAFLTKSFGRKRMVQMKATHMFEENRPIENLWDVSVAATAVARGIEHQDERVSLERAAGEILNLKRINIPA